MSSNHKETALLVFSLSAEKEIERKYIFDKKYRKENTAFFNLLIDRTEKLAEQSEVDVFWMDEHQQTGFNFATRLTNAFQKLFNEGYENVVCIGNDCPDLSIHTLKFAIDKLKSKDLVVGPAKDGGVYLLGINRKVFKDSKFLQLPWQTASLQKGISDYACSEKIDHDVLHELVDIDSRIDIDFYASYRPSTVVANYYKAINASFNRTFLIVNDVIPSHSKYSYVGLRAPPQV